MLIIIIHSLHHVPKVVVFCAAAHVCHKTWFTVGCVGGRTGSVGRRTSCVCGRTLHCDLMRFSHMFIMIHVPPLRVVVVLSTVHYDMINFLKFLLVIIKH